MVASSPRANPEPLPLGEGQLTIMKAYTKAQLEFILSRL